MDVPPSAPASGRPSAAAPVRGRGIPSLDGLRAVSIALVMLGHLGGTVGFPFSAATMDYMPLGNMGVRVFFVISGFLITTLLLKEMDRQDEEIDLGRFYLRRTLRIFPPYFALLGVLLMIRQAGWVQISNRDLVQAATYTSNYNFGRGWLVGHTWSLAVEEQFYLLWPAVLLMLGRRRGLQAAAAFVLAAPIIRLAIWQFLPDYRASIGNSFESVGDAIACGCLLAGARDWLWKAPSYRRLLSGAGPWIALAIVIAGGLLEQRPRIHALLGATAMNVSIALLLDAAVRAPTSAIGRFLNLAPVRYVGVLSYSIYLWQQIFLNRESTALVASFPVNVLAVCVAALASYYVIERPALRLRETLESARWRSWAGWRVPERAPVAPIAAAGPGPDGSGR